MAKKLIADGKAFYGSRISGNILVTPEGFLICKNVPISRVGEQEYLGEELGLNDYNGQLITVIRREEDVFNPKSIASFEGKPFTNDHPTEAVTPENYRQYLKGHVAEIRRGEGIDADKLVADLFVNDPYTIKEIMEKGKKVSINRKREKAASRAIVRFSILIRICRCFSGSACNVDIMIPPI